MVIDFNADEKKCRNCDTAIIGQYCHQCGQTAATGRITFLETIGQFLSATFSVEGPLLSTIRLLVLNPGKVFRDFINGKRKTYYKPVSFFILLMAVYILLRVLIDYDPLAGQFGNNAQGNIPEMQRRSAQAARYMVNNINYIMLFLVLSIGLMLKLFFRKRYNLAEYISIGFYISGIYVIIGILDMFASKYLSFHATYLQLFLLLVIIFYSIYSLFNRLNFWLFAKYLMVSIFSLMLYMILSFGFSFLVVSV